MGGFTWQSFLPWDRPVGAVTWQPALLLCCLQPGPHKEPLSFHMACWHLTQLFNLTAHGFCVQVPGIGQAVMLPAMGGQKYAE